MGAKVYKETIYKQWGFANKDDKQTIQGINYTDCGPMDNYVDTWIISNVTLSWKENKMYNLETSYPTTLVFVSGPKSNTHGDTQSCTARTFNTKLEDDYDTFKLGVFCALQAAADG